MVTITTRIAGKREFWEAKDVLLALHQLQDAGHTLASATAWLTKLLQGDL